MNTDIVFLRAFYASPLGERVVKGLNSEISSLWSTVKGERILGLGYTLPFLSNFQNADRCFAFMPSRIGACQWPNTNHVATSLVFEEDLPLADNSVDRVLLVHSLEFAESAEEMLNEIWRVLSPNGRVIIAVPNRNGLWTRNEATPFGHGEPYSGSQLMRLLRATNFTLTTVNYCLYFLPSQRFLSRLFSYMNEKIATYFFPYFGGVLLVEAQKRLYQGIPVRSRQSRRIFIPALSPQTNARSSLDVTSEAFQKNE